MNLQELRTEKGRIWEQIKAINEKAKAENRALSAEEQVNFDKGCGDIDNLSVRIKTEEKAETLAREFAATNNPGVGRPGTETTTGPAKAHEFRHKLPFSGGERSFRLVPYNPRVATPEYAAAFTRALAVCSGVEKRDMQADVFNVGGALVPPLEFVARLVQDVDDQVFIRQFATVLPLTVAAALGVPTLDTDVADSDWTSELATGSEDTSLRIGRRELRPYPLARRKKISKKLIRASAISADALVRERLAYKQAITQEKAFLSGSGAGQPLGVFTASADGISTGRDVSDGNSSTAIGADGIINAFYSLKPQHQARAISGWHRDAIKMIRKLKTGDGQYLWSPGLNGGQPDQILNRPYFQSEFVPNTFTTGLYVGIVGDFSFYWIAEALGMTVEVLTELYAETNENGYILRSELDGMPVLETAFARVKLA